MLLARGLGGCRRAGEAAGERSCAPAERGWIWICGRCERGCSLWGSSPALSAGYGIGRTHPKEPRLQEVRGAWREQRHPRSHWEEAEKGVPCWSPSCCPSASPAHRHRGVGVLRWPPNILVTIPVGLEAGVELSALLLVVSLPALCWHARIDVSLAGRGIAEHGAVGVSPEHAQTHDGRCEDKLLVLKVPPIYPALLFPRGWEPLGKLESCCCRKKGNRGHLCEPRGLSALDGSPAG